MRAIAIRADIKDLILDAAERLLADKGYKRMTMDDVAQSVGIAKGTIYLHFTSKEDLVLSHIDRIVYRVLVRLQMIAHGGDSAAERVRQMLIARVMIRFDSVQHYSAGLNELLSAIRPALLQRRERHFAEEARVFAEVLKEGQRAGEFAGVDTAATARTLLLATNALLPYSLSVGELGKRKDIAREIGRIAELMLQGLRARD